MPDLSGQVQPHRGGQRLRQAFIVCGYGDRQDIAHGMAEVYLKFKDEVFRLSCTSMPPLATVLASAIRRGERSLTGQPASKNGWPTRS